jgi:hypothetical protein
MLYKIYASFFLCIVRLCFLLKIYGQENVVQSFTLAAANYNQSGSIILQFDWRLDLGTTSIQPYQSKDYFFTVGFLQPNSSRFGNVKDWESYDPLFQLRYTTNQQFVMLYAKESDLIIHGFRIYNANGQVILIDNTKTASSFLAKSIHLSLFPKGVYYLLIFYLPETIATNTSQKYWYKTIKILKQ